MERYVQKFLNRISFIAIAIGTFTLLILYFQTPETCVPESVPAKAHQRFPKSSCDALQRQLVPLDKKNQRLWSSRSWQKQVSSYTELFISLRERKLLHNNSRVLCVSAGAGHEVMALSDMGVSDITAVELVESPPLVRRADPHNLPFFDDVFDLAFSARLEQALFPARYAAEMERTVRPGGVCVVLVDRCGAKEVKQIAGLFRKSRVLGSVNVTLIASKWTRIVMRVRASP